MEKIENFKQNIYEKISEEDWEIIKNLLNQERRYELPYDWDYLSFPKRASNMKLLDSEKFSQFVQLNERDWQAMFNKLKTDRPQKFEFNIKKWQMRNAFNKSFIESIKKKFPEINSDEEIYKIESEFSDWRDFAQLAAKMVILFPEKKQELNLNEEAYNGMMQVLEYFYRESLTKEDGWNGEPSFAGHTIAMKILFPEKIENFHLDDKIWTWLQKATKKTPIGATVNMRLLFPEKEIIITQENWQKMDEIYKNIKYYYQSTKNKNIYSIEELLDYFLNLKILKAKEIKFDNKKGLEII